MTLRRVEQAIELEEYSYSTETGSDAGGGGGFVYSRLADEG